MPKSSSLSRVKSDLYERKWERFQLQKPARLISVEPRLSGLSIRSCQLIDICMGGASVEVTTTIGLPDHYYLNIVGMPERLGCGEIYRKGNRLGVKFIRLLDQDFLSSIIRADFYTR